jgi:integrase
VLLKRPEMMNERLKIIAEDAGIEGQFTTYNIRHSWATIAKYLGISTELISEALGHSSLKTTKIYLKGFDNQVLDKVNALVVGLIVYFFPKGGQFNSNNADAYGSSETERLY